MASHHSVSRAGGKHRTRLTSRPTLAFRAVGMPTPERPGCALPSDPVAAVAPLPEREADRDLTTRLGDRRAGRPHQQAAGRAVPRRPGADREPEVVEAEQHRIGRPLTTPNVTAFRLGVLVVGATFLPQLRDSISCSISLPESKTRTPLVVQIENERPSPSFAVARCSTPLTVTVVIASGMYSPSTGQFELAAERDAPQIGVR